MGKFLPWLQRCIQHWTKPATPMLISGFLSDLPRSRTDLLVENALLRQQLIVLNRQVGRPALFNSDRFRWVFLSPLYKIRETIDSYYSAGYTRTLASGTVSFLLAAKVARKAKDFIGNDQAHPQAGQGESIMGSRAHPR